MNRLWARAIFIFSFYFADTKILVNLEDKDNGFFMFPSTSQNTVRKYVFSVPVDGLSVPR